MPSSVGANGGDGKRRKVHLPENTQIMRMAMLVDDLWLKIALKTYKVFIRSAMLCIG